MGLGDVFTSQGRVPPSAGARQLYGGRQYRDRGDADAVDSALIQPDDLLGIGLGKLAIAPALFATKKFSTLLRQGVRNATKKPLGVLEQTLAHKDVLKSMADSLKSMGVTGDDLINPTSKFYNDPLVREFRGALQNQTPDRVLHGTRVIDNKEFDFLRSGKDIGVHTGGEAEANSILSFGASLGKLNAHMKRTLKSRGVYPEELKGYKSNFEGNKADRYFLEKNNNSILLDSLRKEQPYIFQTDEALKYSDSKLARKKDFWEKYNTTFTNGTLNKGVIYPLSPRTRKTLEVQDFGSWNNPGNLEDITDSLTEQYPKYRTEWLELLKKLDKDRAIDISKSGRGSVNDVINPEEVQQATRKFMKDRKIDSFRYNNTYEGPLLTDVQQSSLHLDANDLRSYFGDNALPNKQIRDKSINNPFIDKNPQLLRSIVPIAGLGAVFANETRK